MHNNNQGLLSPVDALTQSFEMPDSEQVSTQATTAGYYYGSEMVADTANDVQKLFKRQGFRIGDLKLMVPYEDGSEISEMPDVYPVPNAPKWFLGFCNLHGLLIPVFQLKNYFNLDLEAETDKLEIKNTFERKRNMLLVLQHEKNSTGIIIDGLLERIEYHEEQIQKNLIPPAQLNDCIYTSCLIENEVWYDLDSLSFLQQLENHIQHS